MGLREHEPAHNRQDRGERLSEPGGSCPSGQTGAPIGARAVGARDSLSAGGPDDAARGCYFFLQPFFLAAAAPFLPFLHLPLEATMPCPLMVAWTFDWGVQEQTASGSRRSG